MCLRRAAVTAPAATGSPLDAGPQHRLVARQELRRQPPPRPLPALAAGFPPRRREPRGGVQLELALARDAVQLRQPPRVRLRRQRDPQPLLMLPSYGATSVTERSAASHHPPPQVIRHHPAPTPPARPSGCRPRLSPETRTAASASGPAGHDCGASQRLRPCRVCAASPGPVARPALSLRPDACLDACLGVVPL